MNQQLQGEAVDVAIAGLGPTGLMLAHLLGRRGWNVLVLEREPQFYGNARAVYTDDECMRIFQSAGIADELEADMLLDTTAQWVFKNGSVLGQFVSTKRPYGWGVSNFLYQPYLETRLEQLLARYPNVRVRRGRELVNFTQDGAGVALTHAATGGSAYGAGKGQGRDEGTPHRHDVQSVQARYLVGCDGGRSTVRTLLGIKLAGTSFPNPWLVVDLRLKGGAEAFRHIPYFNFYLDPEQPTISVPQPGGHHRFEFMLVPGQTREYMEDPATVRRLLARHVDVDKVEILRKLVYTFNALVAERWRDGRVLLAGDAAHMTPQFMGQGMSSGLRDAGNLAWKLDAVLRAGAGAADALLDSYESERRPHARQMIDASVLMMKFVSQRNPIMAWLRNTLVRVMLVAPGLRGYVREGRFKPVPAYPKGSYFGLPRKGGQGPEGRLLAQPRVRTFEGRHLLLDDALGEGWALLGYGTDPCSPLPAVLRRELDALGARYAAVYGLGRRPQGTGVMPVGPAGVAELEDVDGGLSDWLRAAGTRPGHIVIVRPDKFVYGVVPAALLALTLQALIHQLCRPVPAHKVPNDNYEYAA